MVGRICPPGWDRVKVSENLGVTAVAPVAPADTSLYIIHMYTKKGTNNDGFAVQLCLFAITKD